MKTCHTCARKHLSTVLVLMDEIRDGNDDTLHNAHLIGNLVLAEYHTTGAIMEEIRRIRHMDMLPHEDEIVAILDRLDNTETNT